MGQVRSIEEQGRRILEHNIQVVGLHKPEKDKHKQGVDKNRKGLYNMRAAGNSIAP